MTLHIFSIIQKSLCKKYLTRKNRVNALWRLFICFNLFSLSFSKCRQTSWSEGRRTVIGAESAGAVWSPQRGSEPQTVSTFSLPSLHSRSVDWERCKNIPLLLTSVTSALTGVEVLRFDHCVNFTGRQSPRKHTNTRQTAIVNHEVITTHHGG